MLRSSATPRTSAYPLAVGHWWFHLLNTLAVLVVCSMHRSGDCTRAGLTKDLC